MLAPLTKVDFDKFRLRKFIERLVSMGEVEVHDEPVALADVSRMVEQTAKAVLFRKAGPEGTEMIAAVGAGRGRMAAAFGLSDWRAVQDEFLRRMANPQKTVEVASKDAPVHEVVLKGDDIDLSKLPFHVQHELDGGPYISSAIDYCIDPETGRSNVGCRRLMLRSRNTMRSNLTANSDLKKIYRACVDKKQKLPVTFVIGSHPIDFLGATQRQPVDEIELVATLRGEPLPVVRGVTNGIAVPADAEMTLEGYFDELGWREMEGPYGEGFGYYGPMHIDPVFHVTAITRRRDCLFQTLVHSGRDSGRADSPNMGSLAAEASALKALRAAGIEPFAVCAPTHSGRSQHIRVALKGAREGDARKVFDALLRMPRFKHVFVMDDDIDPFDDRQVDWALATRFRADRDLVKQDGFKPMYMDITMDPAKDEMTKLGFDLLLPVGRGETIDFKVPRAPRFDEKKQGSPRFNTVREALASGPMYFAEIMAAVGSRDGREVSMELEALREEGKMGDRLENGQWRLK
jgi:2,5-furandicarboxylate decarboxylase 1